LRELELTAIVGDRRAELLCGPATTYNYIALSGALSCLGHKGEKPLAPMLVAANGRGRNIRLFAAPTFLRHRHLDVAVSGRDLDSLWCAATPGSPNAELMGPGTQLGEAKQPAGVGDCGAAR
jgi:hypothetical protein